MVIKERQIPSGAPAKDYTEAVNGKECLDFLKAYTGKMTLSFIENINNLLTKNTGVQYPGKLRFFPIRIEGATFQPPPEREVSRLLRKMIQTYYRQRRKLHPFTLACLIHAQFVEIHPFEDGNGRTGRALMNWILMRAGYPQMYIPVSRRQQYYEAIDLHNEKKYKEYCNNMFEIVIDQVSGKLSTNE
jgi:Fic family protein